MWLGPRNDGMVSAMTGRTRRKLRAVADHEMPDDLLDHAVIRSVRVLVVSEVGGVQAAAFAERHARNAAERAIWAALHKLELQTRDAVYEQLGDAAARFTTAERVANTGGRANGAAVTVLSHQLQMRSLVVATKPFIPHFRKLDQHFADGPVPRSSTMSSRSSSRSPSWADECSDTTKIRWHRSRHCSAMFRSNGFSKQCRTAPARKRPLGLNTTGAWRCTVMAHTITRYQP